MGRKMHCVAKWGKALCCSLAGLQTALKKERAFRQEFFLGLILFPVIYVLSVPGIYKLLLLTLLCLLWVVELVNSAIERVVDRISTDHHILSKEAKDMGSASVFVIAMMNLLAWLYVFVYFPQL